MIGCLRLSDVSVICRVVTRIRRVRKFLEYVSCTDCAGQENDFELIPTVKMETRNSMEDYFYSELPAICNHCRVMAA